MGRGSKGILGLFLFGLLIMSFVIGSVGFVSAESLDNHPIIKFLLGDIKGTFGETLAIKSIMILIIALVFAVVLDSIDLFKNHKGIAWIIAFSLAILGGKFIPAQTLVGLLLPTTAEILAVSLGLQFFLILGLNYKLFHGVGMLRRMVWFVWAAALFIFLVKYGIWEFVSGNSYNLLGLITVTKPGFVLTKMAVVLYLVAIIAATSLGATLDGWMAKMFKKEELNEISEKLESTFGKSMLFHKKSAEAADD